MSIDDQVKNLVDKVEKTGRVVMVYPRRREVSISGRSFKYPEAIKKMKEILNLKENVDLDSQVKKLVDRINDTTRKTGTIATLYPRKKLVSISGRKPIPYPEAIILMKKELKDHNLSEDKNLQELVAWQTKRQPNGKVKWEVLKHDKGKSTILASGIEDNILDANREGKKSFEKLKESYMKESSKNFQAAAPASVGGNLQPIGKRDPNTIPPKFAMLLKDTDEDGEVLRLLVSYANGESLIIPPAGEPGCTDGDELLVKVLDCIGSDIETIRVITGALDRSRKVLAEKSLKEESITDRYQKMLNALNVLHRTAGEDANSPANMTKLEAISILRDMGLPDEKAIHALIQSGHSQEEIDDLLALARLGIS